MDEFVMWSFEREIGWIEREWKRFWYFSFLFFKGIAEIDLEDEKEDKKEEEIGSTTTTTTKSHNNLPSPPPPPPKTVSYFLSFFDIPFFTPISMYHV